jgi:hypothetical protein
MGYRLVINGKEIEFPSKADALDFAKGVVTDAPATDKPQKINFARLNGSDPRARMVHKFLTVIVNAGSRGTSTNAIMKAVDIEKPQAFGNRGMNINRLLAKLGFDSPDEVYTNDRNDEGDREWKAGPKAYEALTAVARVAGEE